MTSLYVICGLALPRSRSWLRLCIKPFANCIPDTGRCIFVLLRALTRVVAYYIVKVQNIPRIASGLKVLWYGSMEWNGKNFSMEWKIFVWNGNGMEEKMPA